MGTGAIIYKFIPFHIVTKFGKPAFVGVLRDPPDPALPAPGPGGLGGGGPTRRAECPSFVAVECCVVCPLGWVNYSIHGPPDPPTPEKGPITMEFDDIC